MASRASAPTPRPWLPCCGSEARPGGAQPRLQPLTPQAGGGRPTPRRAAAAGLVAANLAWAAGYPAAAVALRDFSPGLLTVLRLLIGALLLAPALRAAGVRWDRTTLLLAAALGALGFALPIYLQTLGLARSTPALTAILVALEPLLTAVLAGALLHQALPLSRRLALAVALAGAWVIAGLPRPGHAGYLVGDALLILSVACFATYNALSARLTERMPAATAAGATLWAGLLAMVPLWLLGGAALPRHVAPGPAAAAVYLAVVATGLAYVVWIAALGSMAAAEAALYLYLQPVFGVLLSVLLTGERPAAGFYAGAALVLLGVFLGGERVGRRGPALPGPL